MQGTTHCCCYYTWGQPNLYLRIEGEVKSKFIFQILNGYTASCTTKYTETYKVSNIIHHHHVPEGLGMFPVP